MLRLRTTVGLSLFALLVGIGGTAWLSAQTSGWVGPAKRRMVVASHHATKGGHHARRKSTRVVEPVAVVRHLPPVRVHAAPIARAALPELVPIAMPDAPVPYAAMRTHLDGRLRLHLTVDGGGRVTAASLAASSGDPVLDAHALEMVRQWRFAVPADRPAGLSGDLSMRFSVGDRQYAQLR
jgi:periplasmic protein TonB